MSSHLLSLARLFSFVFNLFSVFSSARVSPPGCGPDFISCCPLHPSSTASPLDLPALLYVRLLTLALGANASAGEGRSAHAPDPGFRKLPSLAEAYKLWHSSGEAEEISQEEFPLFPNKFQPGHTEKSPIVAEKHKSPIVAEKHLYILYIYGLFTFAQNIQNCSNAPIAISCINRGICQVFNER